jgi:hypothetical protein
MPPLDDIAKAGSKTFDRALSLVAALIVVAIIIVARYWFDRARRNLAYPFAPWLVEVSALAINVDAPTFVSWRSNHNNCSW